MTRLNEDTRDELINRVIELMHEKLPKEEVEMLAPFTQAYAKTAAPEDLVHRSVIDTYGAFLSHWYFMNHMQDSDYAVRVYNPQFEQHGWQSTHTVIEIIHPEMPFILESVRMVLNRSNLNIHIILHLGDVYFERNANGHISRLLLNHPRTKDERTYSPIFIEIDRQNNPKILEELKNAIEEALTEIRTAVSDWQPMKKALLNTMKRLEQDPNLHKQDHATDIIDFLEWINDEHFTFLGFTKRLLVKEGEKYVWKVERNEQLGILKHYDDNYFESFETLPQRAKEFYFSAYPLITGKTMRRSNVHRPAHTDFIAVKIFDETGKMIGEERFVGLYTAAAYNYSPQNIPLLNAKISKIFEKSGLSRSSYDGKTLLNILENLPRDDLFQAPVSDLFKLTMGILRLQERQRIRLFVRKDDFGRYYSCLVFVPRDKFNSSLRQKFSNILMTQLGGYSVDFNTLFTESVLARIHFIIRFHEGDEKEYDTFELQEKLCRVGRVDEHWNDASFYP